MCTDIWRIFGEGYTNSKQNPLLIWMRLQLLLMFGLFKCLSILLDENGARDNTSFVVVAFAFDS